MYELFIIIVFLLNWCCMCDFTPNRTCCDEPPPDFRLVQPPPGLRRLDHTHCPAFTAG